MKYLAALLLFLIVACRNDGQPVQQIDQIINLYLKDSNGKDLLNKKLAGSYQEVSLKDLGGIRDQVTISTFGINEDADKTNFIEYTAGAKRNLTDSVSPDFKKYRSDIMLQLRKTAADSIDLDTMVVFYEWTPEVFQVRSINYNGKKVFDKAAGQPNKVTVTK